MWVDYAAAVSMHRVRTTNSSKHRHERLATLTVADNRISYECMNVAAAIYESIILGVSSVDAAHQCAGALLHALSCHSGCRSMWHGEQTAQWRSVYSRCSCKYAPNVSIASQKSTYSIKDITLKFRKSLLAGLAVAALSGIAVPMTASADVAVYFDAAPPAVRYEAIPEPREGYVWSSGYWNANANQHEWEAGHWERSRTGYQYAQPSWTQQNNRWELQRGHWNGGEDQK